MLQFDVFVSHQIGYAHHSASVPVFAASFSRVICCVDHINIKPFYCVGPITVFPWWKHALIFACKA